MNDLVKELVYNVGCRSPKKGVLYYHSLMRKDNP